MGWDYVNYFNFVRFFFKGLKFLFRKRKAEDEPDRAPPKKQKTENDGLQQKQNKKIFYYRDLLKEQLKKSELLSLLNHNGYDSISGEDKVLWLSLYKLLGNFVNNNSYHSFVASIHKCHRGVVLSHLATAWYQFVRYFLLDCTENINNFY